jgi:hypothetical protein
VAADWIKKRKKECSQTIEPFKTQSGAKKNKVWVKKQRAQNEPPRGIKLVIINGKISH